MKKKIIEDKTFGTFIALIYECNEEEFFTFVNKKIGTSYIANGARGKTVYRNDDDWLVVYIWINKKNNYITLAHELIHTTRYWLQDFYGINLSCFS